MRSGAASATREIKSADDAARDAPLLSMMLRHAPCHQRYADIAASEDDYYGAVRPRARR